MEGLEGDVTTDLDYEWKYLEGVGETTKINSIDEKMEIFNYHVTKTVISGQEGR